MKTDPQRKFFGLIAENCLLLGKYIHPMIRKICPILLLLYVAILSSCRERESYAPKEIKRLDHALAGNTVLSDSSMLKGASLLFKVSGYGEFNDTTAARYAALPSVGIHIAPVDSAYGDISWIEQGLGQVLGRASLSLPRISVSDAYAVISPFHQSVFTVDSALYIGLNHYLGVGYEPYGYFPDYIRVRKIPERIIPDIAETLVRGAYPYGPSGRVLATLIYEGAVAEAVMQLTGRGEMDVLGYTPQQAKWLEDNESQMWKALIERKMLFSLNPDFSRSLVNMGAVTSILHPESPGAAGRFIGHRILKSYLDNYSRVPLDTMLTPGFYTSDDILKNSHYNPI